MAIQGVIYQNQKVSAEDHAALFQMFISDGILSGCGVSKLRNVLTISSGMFVLAGRLSKIVGSEQITIPDTIRSTTVRLTGVIDLTQSATKTEFHQFSFRLDTKSSNDAFPALKQENINTGGGQYYEVEWAILTIDGDGNITNVDVKIGNSEGTTPSGGGTFIAETDFEFSGDPNKILYTTDGTHWEIIILEAANATLAFKKRPGPVDMCLVAAGNNGHGGNDSVPLQGGSGGEVLTSKGTILAQGAYSVTIGKADDTSDHNTSIYNAGGTDPLLKSFQANGADNGGKTSGQSGGDGTLAFEDDDVLNDSYKGKKYGAGGGIGGRYTRNTSTGQDSATAARGAGGVTGGGIGGITYNEGNSSPGAPGDDNTGSGGGGGFILSAGGHTYYGAGGDGGSGIMFIRDARTAS